MKTRVIFSVILLVALVSINKLAHLTLFPSRAMDVAVRQLEDDAVPFYEVQTFTWGRIAFTSMIVGVFLLLLSLIWRKQIKHLAIEGNREMKNKTILLIMLTIITSMLVFGGCRKPYDKPEYVEIKNNETAFVIPLEGKTSDQGKFASADYLKSTQVATKRIQIPHRFNQTGRRGWQGEWIDTVKVITVNREPVTRQWTADKATGTGGADEAIWVESNDSVTFSVGFSCSAYIEEENAAQFLYQYTSASLAQIMDTEVRARIQSVAAEKCGEYVLDDLRSKKSEVIEAVRADAISFFATKGISITTIGMFGGFTYQNPQIQVAIDQVFEAQQLEDVAEAKRAASEKEKLQIEILADAEAARIAKIAEAEAGKIERIAQAAEKAQENPLFLQLRQLEVEAERITRWDGAYPRWYMGDTMSGTAPSLLLSVDTGE
jgi:regulator of protease activity HflC (stomatin/prohibitin superfamily)